MTAGEVPSTVYGLSDKGWIDQELFSMWFQNHFLIYAPSTRPLLLLMDGHASHYCPDTIHLAGQQKIILFTFPPNTTHLTQPLDKGCFGPLKKEWQNVCHRFMSENPGKVVSRYSFSDLFRQAWFKSMTMNNILAAFSTTGVYPLNRKKLMGEEEPSHSLSKETGLAYIPMFSPVPHRSQPTTVLTFSGEEMQEFSTGDSFENCSDPVRKDRFSKWKVMYRPFPGVHFSTPGKSPVDSTIFHSPMNRKDSVKILHATLSATERCPSLS